MSVAAFQRFKREAEAKTIKKPEKPPTESKKHTKSKGAE